MEKAAFILLMSCCFTTIAQNSNLEYKAAVKIYNISTLDVKRHAYLNLNYNLPPYDLQILHPAFAIQWKNRRLNYHEVELTKLSANQSSPYAKSTPGGGWEKSGTRNETQIALRYEYSYCFAKKKDKKFAPSLGLGFAPAFIRNNFDPANSTDFALSTSSVRVDGQVIPRINYYLNSRFYLDLNIPISILDFSYNKSTNRNPHIPVRQQTISNLDFSVLRPVYSVRLGLAYKL